MGQEIGFSLYEKKPVDEGGKFVYASKNGIDIKTPWVCGRTESTGSWGNLFDFGGDKAVVPVFQKELDGKARDYAEGYREIFKYYDFDDFKEDVLEAIRRDLDDALELKNSVYRRIQENKDAISELRELQKNCTESQEYAFDRWGEEIEQKKEAIASSEEYLAEFDDENYEYCHALAVKDLLAEIEKYVQDGEYYVIPYFSY